MKKVLLFVLSLALYTCGYGQTVMVVDDETGMPLERAVITGGSGSQPILTNAKGQADITPLKGSDSISFQSAGYAKQTFSYTDLELMLFTIRLTTGVTLDEIIVSANRWNQSRRDVPARVITISQRQVALQNPQTAADLLGTSGEVFIQKSQQGGGSPMIRGFSTNRLLYTIDGVRMNTAIFRGGNLQNVISLDPFAIENTEVFFGPGSIIYGSDAIGGVMSFQTLTPQFTFTDEPLVTGKAVARFSSANNERTGHFDVNVGWKKWALVTSISSNDYDDLRMGAFGPSEYLRPFYVRRQDSMDVIIANDDSLIQRPSGYAQMNLMQKIRFRPNDKWDFQYGFHYSTTSSYSRYDRHIRYRRGLPRSGEWYYGPQVWMMNNLNITHTGNNAVYDQMTLRLAQQYFEESRIDRDFNDTERRTRIEKVDAYSLNLDFHKVLGARHKLFYGIEGIMNEVRSMGMDQDIATGKVMPGPSRYPQSTWSSYAAYLNYQVRIWEKLLFQAGARYNQFALEADFSRNLDFYPFPFSTASINDGAVTGSAGVVYDPAKTWSISLSAATGFRAPNVDDVGKVFDSEAGSVVIPNPNLEAEYAYNAEVDIAKVFGKSVKVDVAAYYTLLDNALVRRDYTLNGQDSIMYNGEMSQVQAIQNAARANVYGIQAGVEIKLPQGFGFMTNFNYQRGREELDDGSTSPSRHAPPFYGLTRLTYNAQKLNLQLYAVYSGGREFEDLPEEEKGKPEIYAVDANGNPYSPAWYTLNFKALYSLTETFSVSAGLENITDQRYRPYSSGIVAPGRNFILALRANF